MDFFLKEFPASWAIIGVVVAGVIFYVANRNVFRWQRLAQENLNNIHRETIATLELDRNAARDKAHEERNRAQSVLLENAELKSRPDLTTLAVLLKTQSEAMSAIGKAMNEHIESDTRIFNTINESLGKFPILLEKMNNAFDARQKAVLEHIKQMKS